MLHFVFGIILLGGALYEHEVFGVPLPPKLSFLGLISNLLATLVVLTVVGNMPFELPSDRIKKEDIVGRCLFNCLLADFLTRTIVCQALA
jgi:hypothetical protein